MRRRWLLMLSLVLAAGIAGLRAQAQDTSRYFAETGHAVRGSFLDYWEQHGELAQQGYPISEELTEASDLDGKPYTMQYFERAVFEYHPENAPPYDVLLSQLGTFQYRQKYPQGAPGQQAQTGPDSQAFPQTGHRVGGRFLAYWQSHGGLAQQGYPLSDEFAEKSDLNGQTYTVQYFERAVFELHPENQPPYDVLLSQLGTFRYQARYVGSPTPTVTTRSPSGQVVDQFIASNVFYSAYAAAAGECLFWFEVHGSNAVLYGYDRTRQERFLVSDAISEKHSLTTDGHAVAWIERPPGPSNESLWWYDPDTQQKRLVRTAAPSHLFDGLALDNKMLYYEDNGSGSDSIYTHDLTSGQAQWIAYGYEPRAAGGTVLWATTQHVGGVRQVSLHLRAAGYPTEDRIIAQDLASVSYTVAGDHVIWAYWVAARDSRAMLYTISTQTRTPLSLDLAGSPAVSERWAAWSEGPAAEIHLADLQTGASMALRRRDNQILVGDPVGFLNPQTLVYVANRELHLADFGPIP